MYSNAWVVFDIGDGTSSSPFAEDTSGGSGTDGYFVSWDFLGRSSAGDVYVIQMETPEGKRPPEAILYQGGKKVLYEAKDTDRRIFLEPRTEEFPDVPLPE